MKIIMPTSVSRFVFLALLSTWAVNIYQPSYLLAQDSSHGVQGLNQASFSDLDGTQSLPLALQEERQGLYWID